MDTSYVIWTILGCGLVTWLARVAPFILLKHRTLPPLAVSFLSFVPISIMAALWFSSLFVQHLGRLPSVNVDNLLASLPTVAAAVISKNLLVIVVLGIISLAIIRAI